MSIIPGDEQSEIKPVIRDDKPSSRVVNDFHTHSDVDRDLSAQHHTLGISRNKASSGTHIHTGKDSRKVGHGAGLVVTGSKGGNAALTSLLSMLSNVIDFDDNTT